MKNYLRSYLVEPDGTIAYYKIILVLSLVVLLACCLKYLDNLTIGVSILHASLYVIATSILTQTLKYFVFDIDDYKKGSAK